MISVKDSHNLNDQTYSRRRKQQLKLFIALIIFLILIFAAIISVLTMIKRDYESELPANNPHKAIESICSLTPYYQDCFRYMSNSLYKNKNQLSSSSKIDSSKIFSLSLHTAINELKKFTLFLKSNNFPNDQSTPSQCESLFNSSVSQLNSYLAIINEKNLTVKMTLRSEMMSWLETERPKIGSCLYWLEYEKELDTKNARNSLMILANMNKINEMFNPSITSVLGFDLFRRSGKSIFALFLSDKEFVGTVCIFGLQFIFLLLLVCLLLRVW